MPANKRLVIEVISIYALVEVDGSFPNFFVPYVTTSVNSQLIRIMFRPGRLETTINRVGHTRCSTRLVSSLGCTQTGNDRYVEALCNRGKELLRPASPDTCSMPCHKR